MKHIVGLLAPGTIGESQSQGQTDWTLCLSFAAWRADDGPVQHRPLYVLVNVPKQLIRQAEIRFPALSQVRVTCAPDRPIVNDRLLAQWGDLKAVAGDPELILEAERLRKPVVFSQPGVCDFELDRSLGVFIGHATWEGTTVDVHLGADGELPEGRALASLIAVWNDQARWRTLALNKLADETLAQANEFVADDQGAAPLGRHEYIESQRLSGIWFGSDQPDEFAMCFECDRMIFGDHALEVHCCVTKGALRVEWL